MTAMNFLNAAGVSHSFRVIVPTILATACASAAAVIAAKSFQRLPGFVAQPDEILSETQSTAVKPAGISPKAKFWLTLLGTLFIGVSALELGPPLLAADRAGSDRTFHRSGQICPAQGRGGEDASLEKGGSESRRCHAGESGAAGVASGDGWGIRPGHPGHSHPGRGRGLGTRGEGV